MHLRIQAIINNFTVTIKALALVYRSLIGIQTQPIHSIQDSVYILLRGALLVRIFDTQDKLAAVVPGIEPAKQRGTNAANVKHSRWAWGESGSNGHYLRPVDDVGPAILSEEAQFERNKNQVIQRTWTHETPVTAKFRYWCKVRMNAYVVEQRTAG